MLPVYSSLWGHLPEHSQPTRDLQTLTSCSSHCRLSIAQGTSWERGRKIIRVRGHGEQGSNSAFRHDRTLYSLVHSSCDCLPKTCPRSSRSTVRHRWGGLREPPLSSDHCCFCYNPSFRWIKLFPGAILFSPIALLVTLFLTFRALTMKSPSVFSFHASTSGRTHSAP